MGLFHSIRSVWCEGESCSRIGNWALESMALKTHPEGVEGVYENNLPRVAGVEVEIRKAKKIQ